MIPTNKLRFVKRLQVTSRQNGLQKETIHVLQQWWETVPMGTINTGWSGDIPLGDVKGEWRDVPLEKEE